MVRSPTSRLSAALAALVFAYTGGITGAAAHPLAPHGLMAGGVVELAQGQHAHHAGLDGMPQHQGHPGHHAGDDCTCLGPCPGGATPPLRDATPPADRFDFGTIVREEPSATAVIHSDPRSYLHPLPNGPPPRT